MNKKKYAKSICMFLNMNLGIKLKVLKLSIKIDVFIFRNHILHFLHDCNSNSTFNA